jgi:hypothetical protein
MSSRLLRNTLPLVIDPQFATAVGLNEAIVIQQLHYWLKINERNDRNGHDGHYWTYNSYPEWQKQFPFWSEHTIRRIFQELEAKGLLISGNFNASPIDRTKWYRLNYERLSAIPIPELDRPINENLLLLSAQNARPSVQNGRMDVSNLDAPIPKIIQRLTANKEMAKKTYGEFRNVNLTEIEYEKLTGKFGAEQTLERIESLSRYQESVGKHYKSHYATLLSWNHRDNRGNARSESDLTSKYTYVNETEGDGDGNFN